MYPYFVLFNETAYLNCSYNLYIVQYSSMFVCDMMIQTVKMLLEELSVLTVLPGCQNYK